MPIFEGYCNTESCSRYKRTVEMLLKHYSLPNKPCPECKNPVNRLVGKPNVVWAKPLGSYQGNEGDGHWVHGQHDPNDPTTKYQRFITTRQEQLEHCKANGLYDPMEIGRVGAMDDAGQEEGKALINTWSAIPGSLTASGGDNWI